MTGLHLSLLVPEWTVLGVFLLLLTAEIFKSKTQETTLDDTRSYSITGFLGTTVVLIVSLLYLKTSEFAFGGMYAADPLASFFKCFFVTVFFFVLPMGYAFFVNTPFKVEEYYLILWTTLLGLFFLASANDLILIFITLEIVTLSFYILAAYQKTELASIEAGLKYLIIGSLASAFLIFGIALIYMASGETALPAIYEFFETEPRNPLMTIGILFLISGLGFKVAAAPFHLWAPDVYQGAPAPTVAFLSVGSKAAGIFLLIRLLFGTFVPFQAERELLFSGFAAMTLLYGSLGALHQTNIKRLLGYSSIGHAGYLLIGIAAGEKSGVTSVLYYLMAYAVSNLAIFWVVVVASRRLKSDQIEAYRGLAKRSPFLAACLFLSVLSLAGVPPTAGFFGKFLILLAAVKSGLGWLALLGALGVAVSLYYYLNLVRVCYVDEPAYEEKIRVPLSYRLLMSLLMLGILGLGVWQKPFLRLAHYVAASMF